MADDTNKFAGLDKLIREAKSSGVDSLIVATPQALGDSYEEMISNLDKIAAAELALIIVPPDQRFQTHTMN